LIPTTSAVGTLWSVLALAGVLAGVFIVAWLANGPRPWLAVIAAALGLGWLFFAISRAARSSLKQHSRNEARVEALEAGATALGEFEIERKAGLVWPSILTLLFAAPAAIFFLMGKGPRGMIFLLLGLVISSIAWLVAWWAGRGVIATLTSNGIKVRGEEIAWSGVESLDVSFLPRIETGQLVIRLKYPQTPHTMRARIDSSLSAGESDRQIVLSLARARENPAVIFELAQSRWKNAVGERRAQAAQDERFAEAVRANRKFGQLLPAEKRQSTITTVAILTPLLFAVHGMYAEFIPSRTWLLTSIVIAAVLAVWGSLAIIRARKNLPHHGTAGTPSFLALFLGFTMLIGTMAGLCFAKSLPDILTRHIGSLETRLVDSQKLPHRDNRGCDKIRLYFDDGDTHTYCASSSQYANLPKAGKLRIELRKSWFGIHIASLSTIGN
jgi:hypothetical protein